MKTDHLPPEVRAGRFSARFSFYEQPDILERLGRVADEGATSAASIVRLALRQFLRDFPGPEPR